MGAFISFSRASMLVICSHYRVCCDCCYFHSVVRRLSTTELSELLLSGHVLLLLVDHRFLHCSSCCSTAERSQRRAAPEFSGHFVLAVSLDPATGTVRFLDPDGRHTLCSAPLAELDEARRSDGTDEDVIIVRLEENKGRVPKLVHRAAVGIDETGAASASASASAAASSATAATAAPAGKSARSAPGSSSASMLLPHPVRRSARLASASSSSVSAACASLAPPPPVPAAAASASGSSAAASSAGPTAAVAAAAGAPSSSLVESSDIVLLPHGFKLPGLSATELALLRAKQRRIRSTRAAVERSLPGGKNAPAALRNALASCLIFAQEEAGSAVCVHPGGWILTCAHCIGESPAEWRSNRLKWLLTTSGVAVRARCEAWDPKRDLALLRVVAVELEAECGPASSAAVPIFSFVSLSPIVPTLGAALLCIGQPGSEDLETNSSTPVASGYDLVHVSTGSWRGLVPGTDPHDCEEIGSGRHDCWTYWGHSGAPLLRKEDGSLVGLHSSWDDQTAMRHGVPLEPLHAFLKAHLPELPGPVTAAAPASSAASSFAASAAARLS